jgi:hypothetical protein
MKGWYSDPHCFLILGESCPFKTLDKLREENNNKQRWEKGKKTCKKRKAI